MTFKIRSLELTDKEVVTNTLGRRTIEEDLKRPELFNLQQLENLFNITLAHGNGFIVEENELVVGVIGGIEHGHILQPDVRCFTALFWFVLPEYRKSRAGWYLLREIKKYSLKRDLELSLALQEYSLKDDTIMQKLGFKKGEVTYRYGGYYGT